jgi:hypothetical protein
MVFIPAAPPVFRSLLLVISLLGGEVDLNLEPGKKILCPV